MGFFKESFFGTHFEIIYAWNNMMSWICFKIPSVGVCGGGGVGMAQDRLGAGDSEAGCWVHSVTPFSLPLGVNASIIENFLNPPPKFSTTKGPTPRHWLNEGTALWRNTTQLWKRMVSDSICWCRALSTTVNSRTVTYPGTGGRQESEKASRSHKW